MRQRARKHLVRVRTDAEHGGGEVVKEVWAETSDLAAGMASTSEPAGVVLGLTIRVDYVGRCERCKCYVESGDAPVFRHGQLYCRDC